jgi:hypothetical protein
MKFSIVIPTRSRAQLLRHALASALGQDFDDFEVVVSDNCSTDATAEVLRSAAHPRLRVVRPERPLSMVDHWEFALGQARGEWVLFLCDDDALLPQTLSVTDTLAREQPWLELVRYRSLTFTLEGVSAQGGNYIDLPGALASPAWPLAGCFVPSRECLQHSFRRLQRRMPSFLNSAARRSLLERVWSAHGRMFWNWAPDYSSGCLTLAHTERFADVGPLLLWGDNLLSYGTGSYRDPNYLRSFFAQFDDFDGQLPFSPYPGLLTVTNALFDTFCRMRDVLGPLGAGLEIDPLRFHRRLLKDVERYRKHGHPGYEAHIAELQGRVRRLRAGRALHPLALARSLASDATVAVERIRRSVGRRLPPHFKLVRRQFPDIAEAARALGRTAARPTSSTRWRTSIA